MKALILEGPEHATMRGWRHFQVIIRLEHGQRVSSCIGQVGSGERFARDLRGKFFPAGSWELLGVCKFCGTTHAACEAWKASGKVACCPECVCRSMARVFPTPRPEILDLLVSENQRELPV